MSDPGGVSGRGEGPASTAPEDFSLAGPEDLLGRRIAAALIDLVVLAGLLVILSTATGQLTTSGSRLTISLKGAWTGVFLAVALLYYFALEAWAGQTLGKVLLNVRVVHAGGTRPSVRAVALRTLLRIVDWLPLLYMAGFITTLATGTRRQRIGDLAARTVMAQAARPARDRTVALLPLAIVVMTAIILPASRSTSGGTQTYRDHGVSFTYPAGWSSGIPHGGTRSGSRLWSTAVSPRTRHELIVVESYQLNIAVAAENIDALVPSLAGRLQRLGATLRGSPQKITMAELPAVQFHTTEGHGGSLSQSTIVFAFNGTTEYFVNCQYAPALATDARHACHQVVSTFHVG